MATTRTVPSSAERPSAPGDGLSGQPAVTAAVGSSRPLPWGTIAWFSALLGILYAPVLRDMATEWFTQDEMGHGVFVPVVAAYVAWMRRDELASIHTRPTWWGAVLVAVGFAELLVGFFGSEFFITRIGFLCSLLGVLLMTGGMPLVRKLAFPLALLPFMIRIPLFIYSQITFKLQIIASRLAEASLSMLGIPVLRSGNVLELASQKLSVVEACSGIRSLISLCFLAMVYAYFFDSKPWMRAALLFAAIPIAILANAGRITITGLLSEYDTQLAQGVYHTMEGWVIFIFGLGALALTHFLLNRIYGVLHARR